MPGDNGQAGQKVSAHSARYMRLFATHLNHHFHLQRVNVHHCFVFAQGYLGHPTVLLNTHILLPFHLTSPCSKLTTVKASCS